MRRATTATLAVAAALAAAAATLLARTAGPAGATTPESAVSGYVTALHDADPRGLSRLADPAHDASAEIPARLRRLGAGRLTVTATTIGTTESDAERPADLTGTLDGAAYGERLWLVRHDGRWFVALGPNRNAHPKAT